MKSLLIAIVAAVLLVGYWEAEQLAPASEAKTKNLTLKFHNATGNGNNEGVKNINAYMYKRRFSCEVLA
jgi:high-affinity Fe2+/Pb2+ permease